MVKIETLIGSTEFLLDRIKEKFDAEDFDGAIQDAQEAQSDLDDIIELVEEELEDEDDEDE